MHGLGKTCLEMCAADLTDIYSPSLFEERAVQLGLSCGPAADLVIGLNLDSEAHRQRHERPKMLTFSVLPDFNNERSIRLDLQ